MSGQRAADQVRSDDSGAPPTRNPHWGTESGPHKVIGMRVCFSGSISYVACIQEEAANLLSKQEQLTEVSRGELARLQSELKRVQEELVQSRHDHELTRAAAQSQAEMLQGKVDEALKVVVCTQYPVLLTIGAAFRYS